MELSFTTKAQEACAAAVHDATAARLAAQGRSHWQDEDAGRLLRGVDIKLHGVNDDVFISALGQHQCQQAAPGTNIQDPLYARNGGPGPQ